MCFVSFQHNPKDLCAACVRDGKRMPLDQPELIVMSGYPDAILNKVHSPPTKSIMPRTYSESWVGADNFSPIVTDSFGPVTSLPARHVEACVAFEPVLNWMHRRKVDWLLPPRLEARTVDIDGCCEKIPFWSKASDGIGNYTMEKKRRNW